MAYALMWLEQGDDAALNALRSPNADLRVEAQLVLKATPRSVEIPAAVLEHCLLRIDDIYVPRWATWRTHQSGTHGRSVFARLTKTPAGRAALTRALDSLAHAINQLGDRVLEPADFEAFIPALQMVLAGEGTPVRQALDLLAKQGVKAASAAPHIEALIARTDKDPGARPKTEDGWYEDAFDKRGRLMTAALHAHVRVTQTSTFARAALGHLHPAVAYGAAKAMGELETPSQGDLEALLETARTATVRPTATDDDSYWRDTLLSGLAAGLAGVIKQRPAFTSQVAALLDSPNAAMRRTGLKALADIDAPTPEHLARVFELLASDEEDEWRAASRLVYPFIRILRAEALPVLLTQVASPNVQVRNELVGSFRVLGWTAGSALEDLRALAQEGSELQRKTARLAIDGIRARYERDARSPFHK